MSRVRRATLFVALMLAGALAGAPLASLAGARISPSRFNFGGNGLTGTGAITPNANDGGALGSATLSYSDAFLATGGVINWNNGAATIRESGGDVIIEGAAGGVLTVARIGGSAGASAVIINDGSFSGIYTLGAAALSFGVNSAARWSIEAASPYTLSPVTDGSADLGAAGTRLRSGYFATSLVAPLYTSAAATAISARPGAASGADQAGADFTLSGGQSTGTGTGGNVVISASVHAAASASSVNGLHTVATFSNLHQGGAMMLPRATGDAAQPGSGNVTLYVVCGANAGTLAIVAKSGTNNTHTTVVNNLGSGNSGC